MDSRSRGKRFNVSSGNETLYKPDFARANWAGNLFAFPVSSAGVVDYANPRWDAAARIKAQNYTNTTWNPTGRKIVTMKSDGAKIPFSWASLDPTQQIVLGNATAGPNVVNYIRGDRTNESANRLSPPYRHGLGDIVHSRPFYVGGANPRVYVAANDGMLHAFDATTGDEVFAYIPSIGHPQARQPYRRQRSVHPPVLRRWIAERRENGVSRPSW
jgi:type IV pilus assembly protein PilY1